MQVVPPFYLSHPLHLDKGPSLSEAERGVLRDLREANLRIVEVELAKKRGTLLPPAEKTVPDGNPSITCETMTVVQLMEEYVNLYGLSRWSEDTLSCNQHRINNYILPYIGHLPIKSLTTHQPEQFYRRLLSRRSS